MLHWTLHWTCCFPTKSIIPVFLATMAVTLEDLTDEEETCPLNPTTRLASLSPSALSDVSEDLPAFLPDTDTEVCPSSQEGLHLPLDPDNYVSDVSAPLSCESVAICGESAAVPSGLYSEKLKLGSKRGSSSGKRMRPVINCVQQQLPKSVVRKLKGEDGLTQDSSDAESSVSGDVPVTSEVPVAKNLKVMVTRRSESKVTEAIPGPLKSKDAVPKSLKVMVTRRSDTIKNEVLVLGLPEGPSRKRKLSKGPDSSSSSNSKKGASETEKSISGDSNQMTPLQQDDPDNLSKNDKFFEIKQAILHATRNAAGVNKKKYSRFTNVFLKNWRFSKQFQATNARGRQIVNTLLLKIVKELVERKLIKVKGPVDEIEVVKLLVGEVKRDNSKIFSQTPPTLTVLVTDSLFNRYYKDPDQGSIRKPAAKSVSLGNSTDQWLKLKNELGMEAHSEVAAILIHCYKAWTSVACSKCRRHMEVGMEQKTGKSLANSESSICIVSCDCGKSTSGGFMIECDNCHKWQHGVCVDVDKVNVPESYNCTRCRNIRDRVILAERKAAEESDDSVVSIDNTELCSTDGSEPEIIELD